MLNGWLTIVTSDELAGLIPFLLRAANSYGWLPQHQTPTFLPRILAIVSMPFALHVSSVIPERAKTCATETRPLCCSRVANRFGSQSTPMSACLPLTTSPGVMLGPPTLM